jgi:hypothetical protein
MNSLEIIQKFQQQISWTSMCETIDLFKLMPDFYVMRHENTWFVPIDWNSDTWKKDIWFYGELTRVYIQDYLEKKNQSMCIIWGGEVPARSVEEICEVLLKIDIAPCWIDPESMLNYTDWVYRISDGVDWQRTFEAFSDSSKPKVIMEWDK